MLNGQANQMNETMYVKLEKDKRKKLIERLAANVNLYSFPDKYALLDEDKCKLLYLVQFKFAKFFGKKGITQIQVWRDKTSPLTKGIAEKIFFDHLFPMADCVVTDKQQTSYGRAFWELRIYEAFGKGLPIYLLDQNEHTKKLLATSEEFDQLSNTWWGDDPKYQARKIAICHKELWQP